MLCVICFTHYAFRYMEGGWRICFWWRDGDAYDVELNNHYH